MESNNTRTDDSLTVLTIPNTVIPFSVPLYIRLQYIDANDNASEFSDGTVFTLQPFSNLNVIIQEDFENVPVNGLPENWKAVISISKEKTKTA